MLRALGGGPSPIQWSVMANLDVPMGLDVSKAVQVVVQGPA